MRLWGNDYNKMEFAGAFGDLGTLIPFVVGYITINKMIRWGYWLLSASLKSLPAVFQNPHSHPAMKAIGGWLSPSRTDYPRNDLGIGNF